MNINKSFNSKILLFGEYSVIKDSMALCIPYNLFEGSLSFPSGPNPTRDKELKAFCQFLRNLNLTKELIFEFDIDSFEFDIGQGLYFNSTIPQGFGVGSSGALSAALFDRYGKEKSQLGIKELKAIFSQMESHFHGASSGVDPLISYINRPILISESRELRVVDIPEYNSGKGVIFLLNTGRPRRTEPLVNLFLEKCKNEDFENLIKTVLSPITNRCISNFLKNEKVPLYEFFRDLSDFQRRHFSPMIPKLYQEIWNKGLESEKYYLKLCGAGGGGFLLGIAKNFEDAKLALRDQEIRPLFYF